MMVVVSTSALAVNSNSVNNMKRLCIMLAAVASFWPLPQVFSMPIENVRVQIVDTNKGTSAPLLEKMNNSMQIVAEQLLQDKDVETTEAVKADYAKLLAEIGDRVFTGYELQQVEMSVASNTTVKLYLRPWSGTIQQTRVEVDFSGLGQQTAAMLRKRIPRLEEELEQIVTGASIDAVDWAGSILRKQVREKVEQALPEFKAAVDLVQDGKTNNAVVQVVIYPIGEAVTDIVYEMHSESVPNLLLMQLKYKYAERCNEFRGLPVGYVKRHKQELANILEEELKLEPIVGQLNLIPKVILLSGADTSIDISLNTNKYKIWADGYADIGRKDDNLSGKAHIGKYFSPKDEMFVEQELVTDNVHWSTNLGYARTWGKSTWSFRRRIPEADNIYKLEYKLEPKWTLRMEHSSGNNRNEYAVRYRIHEFLSAEYVYGGKESYLRIIGNL